MIVKIFIGLFALRIITFFILRTYTSKIFLKYAQKLLLIGLSGKDIAERILKDYSLYNVKVVDSDDGTDYYNQYEKTVNLKPEIYNGSNVYAASVTINECANAILHAKYPNKYKMIRNLEGFIDFIDFIDLVFIICLIFSIISLKTLLIIYVVTEILNVFLNFLKMFLSKHIVRIGMEWLNRAGITQGIEHTYIKNALWWLTVSNVR